MLMFLWYYFSWSGNTEPRGAVLSMDCQAFRPLSFMLQKQEVRCAENDFVCAVQEPECSISYTMAYLLANSALEMIVRAFT